jgi:hypothetical protein
VLQRDSNRASVIVVSKVRISKKKTFLFITTAFVKSLKLVLTIITYELYVWHFFYWIKTDNKTSFWEQRHFLFLFCVLFRFFKTRTCGKRCRQNVLTSKRQKIQTFKNRNLCVNLQTIFIVETKTIIIEFVVMTNVQLVKIRIKLSFH